jgi:DNA-directed RNA polymerase II subunit RPB1
MLISFAQRIKKSILNTGLNSLSKAALIHSSAAAASRAPFTTDTIHGTAILPGTISINPATRKAEFTEQKGTPSKLLPQYTRSTAKRCRVIGAKLTWSKHSELIRLSVCRVFQTTSYNKNIPTPNGLFSLTMGTVDPDFLCATCGKDADNCLGHYGHMELFLPVCNVLVLPEICQDRQSTCVSCSRVLLPESHPAWPKICAIADPRKRKAELAKQCIKFDYCGGPPPEGQKFDPRRYLDDASSTGGASEGCHARQPIWFIHKTEIVCLERKAKESKRSVAAAAAAALASASSSRKLRVKKGGGKKRIVDAPSDSESDVGDASDVSDIGEEDDADGEEKHSDDEDDDDDDDEEEEKDDDADIIDADIDIDASHSDQSNLESVKDASADASSGQGTDLFGILEKTDTEGVDDEDGNPIVEEDDEDKIASAAMDSGSGFGVETDSLGSDIEFDKMSVSARTAHAMAEKEKASMDKMVSTKKRAGERIPHTPADGLALSRNILPKHYHILGYTVGVNSPIDLYLESLVVTPPANRVTAICGGGTKNRTDSDATKHYKRILQFDITLREKAEAYLSSGKDPVNILKDKGILEAYFKLQRACAAYYDNEMRGVTRVTGHTKIPFKSATYGINGKGGKVRGQNLAKRGDHGGRTVISPSVDHDLDYLGVPEEMSMILTYPEMVTQYNIKQLRRCVQRGPHQIGGANSVIEEDGRLIDLRHAPNFNINSLRIGMIVERHLRNGDVVLFGRQPSLHKMSLMSMVVFLHKGLTFLLNLAVTTPYNADFDGDEMNLYFPQNEMARVEAYKLMRPHQNMLGPSDSASQGLKQDAQLSAHAMTNTNVTHTREEVISFAGRMAYWNGYEKKNAGLPIPALFVGGTPRPPYPPTSSGLVDDSMGLRSTGAADRSGRVRRGAALPLWTGKQCASLTFPRQGSSSAPPDAVEGFRPAQATCIRFSRGMDDLEAIMNDEAVLIQDGHLLLGRLDKSIVGASRDGLVQHIVHDFGNEICRQFLSDAQRFFNYWISQYGYGMSIADCPTKFTNTIKGHVDTVVNYLQKYDHDIDLVKEEVTCDLLETLKNKITGLIQRQSSGYENRYLMMIASGTKGTTQHFSQTNGILGSQRVSGERLELAYGNRAFPHSVPFTKNPKDRGFVDRCLMQGLDPIQTFIHAMGGREGLVDTAVRTGKTGYFIRIMLRAMDDIIASWNGTIRDQKYVISFAYGGNSFDSHFIQSQVYPMLAEGGFPLLTSLEELYHLATDGVGDEVLARIPEINKDEMKRTLKIENETISQDMEILREMILSFDKVSISNELKAPVAFLRILEDKGGMTASLNPLSSSVPSTDCKDSKTVKNDGEHEVIRTLPLSPLYVFGQVRKMIQHCRSQVNCVGALFVFEALARHYLSTRSVIGEHKLTKEQFDRVIIQVKSKFQEALVQSGEAIGCITGQSIGEQSQQMTLNTFHAAGQIGRNHASGVSRMDDITRVSRDAKKLRQASMDIVLDERYQNVAACRKFIKTIRPRELKDFVYGDQCQMLWDPNPRTTLIEEDKEFVNNYTALCEEKEFKNLSPLVCRFVINAAKCAEYSITPDDLFWKMRDCLSKGHFWITSDSNSARPIFILRPNIKSKEFNKYQKKKSKRACSTNVLDTSSSSLSSSLSLSNMKNLTETVWQMRKMLLGTVVHGVPGILSGSIQTRKCIDYDKITGAKSIKEEMIIDTKGSNLKHVLGMNGVDTTRTYSTSMVDVEKALGIEAATVATYEELVRLFKNSKISVDKGPPMTVAQALSRSGMLVGFGKNGYHQDPNHGTLKNISFERIVKTIIERASAGSMDKCESITANVMTGQLVPVGTGTVKILSKPHKEFMTKHSEIIAANEKVLRTRMMKPLEVEDVVRLVPSTITDSRYRRVMAIKGRAASKAAHLVASLPTPQEVEGKVPNYDYLTNPTAKKSRATGASKSTVAGSHQRATSKISEMIKCTGLQFSRQFTPTGSTHPSTATSVVAATHSGFLDSTFSNLVEGEKKRIFSENKLQFHKYPNFTPYPLQMPDTLCEDFLQSLTVAAAAPTASVSSGKKKADADSNGSSSSKKDSKRSKKGDSDGSSLKTKKGEVVIARRQAVRSHDLFSAFEAINK